MKLEIADPVLVAVTRRTAAAATGVARLHDLPWRSGPVARARGRAVEVDRTGARPVVTVRLVLRRGHPAIDVVRTVQRSVRDELLRTTGLTAEVVVVVVDVD